MDDRGDKIVNLARAMLHTDCSTNPTLLPTPSHESPFKALCLTALIAAIGGGVVSSYINEANRPLTIYEKTEIDALIFYAARQNAVEETAIRNELKTFLSVDSPVKMTMTEYIKARDYLRNRVP